MKKYQLQVKLRDGKVIPLDLPVKDSLIEIDRFTNGMGFYQLCSMVSSQVDVNQIDQFQIGIYRKNFSYSVVFQNAYLSELFSTSSLLRNAKGYFLSPTCYAYQEMKQYVFHRLDTDFKNFFATYPYQNHFLVYAKKYVNVVLGDLEDDMEKDTLKRKIEQKLQEYPTFRSFCIYRSRFGYSYHPVSSKSKVEKLNVSSSFSSTITKNKDSHWRLSNPFSVSGVQNWYNESGEEREEFLEEEELKRMVKEYGED